MKIDDIISRLQRVRYEKGNVEVIFGAWCGTNSGHVNFEMDTTLPEKFDVSRQMNDLGQLSLSLVVTDKCRDRIIEGRNEMRWLGYDFVPSQFREFGEEVRVIQHQSIYNFNIA